MERLLQGVVLLLIVLHTCITDAAKCPESNIAFTGKNGLNWIAYVNGDFMSKVLFPSYETHFINRDPDINEIVISLEKTSATLELLQVTIETKNAKEVTIQELGKTRKVPYFPGRWQTTTFNCTSQAVDDVTILVLSYRGEVAVRNIYVKGCLRKVSDSLIKFFNAKLKVFSGLWVKGEKAKMVDNFYTKDAMLMLNDMPIVQGRQNNIKHLDELMSKYTVSDLDVIKAVQMSEIRIYTIHNADWLSVDQSRLKARGRLFIIWRLVKGDWLIDVLSRTRAEKVDQPHKHM